eukprot:gene8570-395_t
MSIFFDGPHCDIEKVQKRDSISISNKELYLSNISDFEGEPDETIMFIHIPTFFNYFLEKNNLQENTKILSAGKFKTKTSFIREIYLLKNDIPVAGLVATEYLKNEPDDSKRYRVYVNFLEKTGLEENPHKNPTLPQFLLKTYVEYIEVCGFLYLHLWIDSATEKVGSYIFKNAHKNNKYTPKNEIEKKKSDEILKNWYFNLLTEFEPTPYQWSNELNIFPPSFDDDVKNAFNEIGKNAMLKIAEIKRMISKLSNEIDSLFADNTLVIKLEQPILTTIQQVSIDDECGYKIRCFTGRPMYPSFEDGISLRDYHLTTDFQKDNFDKNEYKEKIKKHLLFSD